MSSLRTPDPLPANRAQRAAAIRASVERGNLDSAGGRVEWLVEGRTASVPIGRSTDRPESGCGVHDTPTEDRAVA